MSVSTSVASTAERAIDVACVAITSRRLSTRSARTPAKRPKTVNGMKRQNASAPTAIGECVSSTTSQASAMFCIHVPLTEISWPVKKRR